MYLKNCVNSLLEKAEELELESIAIPLISSGVFGGDPIVCSKIICETMSDYFENITDSYITQVLKRYCFNLLLLIICLSFNPYILKKIIL